ncbi:MAG: contractile injection system protein, VgrG/Pvc8 family [Oscillibacter sp.]
MNTRKAEVELTYNGAAVTSKMIPYKDEIVYTDPASGEADSLDIAIHDRDRQWTVAWLPRRGDTMTAAIRVTDWNQEGDNRTMPCGFFILDDFSFGGWPVTGTLSGVSVPADGGFRATERTKTWEKATIQEIGKEIAKRAGITLVWDVPGTPFVLASIEQSEQTDCDFFAGLCKTYGYSMKVYAQKIVVFDREAYKKTPPVATVKETMITAFGWHQTLNGTYTGGEYTYTSPKTEEELKATVGTGTRILKQSGKADSKADAERKIRAAVNDANHAGTTLSITMTGNAFFTAAQCVTVVGLGKLSGKYYIDKVTHHIGNGYTMDLELALVAGMTEEVIRDATERLAAVGVMDTPGYWIAHYKDVKSLDGLILNMATRIKTNAGGKSITTVAAALNVLTDAGVINSPDYWAGAYTKLAYLDGLIIKAANALTAG